MIYLTPEGGLCNRMRSIASVWLLAKSVGQPLIVNWWRTDDMNCSFAELFQMENIPFVVRELNAVGFRSPFVKVGIRVYEYVLMFLGKPVFDPQSIVIFLNQHEALYAWAAKGNPRIRTSSKIIDSPKLFDIFKPVLRLQAIINSYSDNTQHSIGVHIRRSDNIKSSNFSPTERFIELMYAELKINPKIKFFIATDSSATFLSLKNEFGDAVYEHKKISLERDNSSAICDALVDLYCLASCQKLFGSYWSSFSDTAWAINDIEHVIIYEK